MNGEIFVELLGSDHSFAVELFDGEAALVGKGAVSEDLQILSVIAEPKWARVHLPSGGTQTVRVNHGYLSLSADVIEQASIGSLGSRLGIERASYSRSKGMRRARRGTIEMRDGTRIALIGVADLPYIDDERAQVSYLFETLDLEERALEVTRGNAFTRIQVPGNVKSLALALESTRESGAESTLSLAVKTSSRQADAVMAYLSAGNFCAASCYSDWARDVLLNESIDPWTCAAAALFLISMGDTSAIEERIWTRGLHMLGATEDWSVIRAWTSLTRLQSHRGGFDELTGAVEFGRLPTYSESTKMLLLLAQQAPAESSTLSTVRTRVGYLLPRSPYTASVDSLIGAPLPRGGLPIRIDHDQALPLPVSQAAAKYRFGG
jgi:hypothetical protein